MGYYVVEGIDGTGKDTQVDLLCTHLQLINEDTPPVRVAEPDETNPVGQLMRQFLRAGTYPPAHATLFCTDRIVLQETKILPALKLGISVVSSRSFLSTLVYQQENHPLDWLFQLHSRMLVYPTHIIILDMDPQVALERVQKRGTQREYYERQAVQERNRKRYLDLAQDERLSYLLGNAGKVVVVDAAGDPLKVHNAIWQAIQGARE